MLRCVTASLSPDAAPEHPSPRVARDSPKRSLPNGAPDMPRTEVNWTRTLPEGGKRQGYAHRIGNKWVFHARAKRFDPWIVDEAPPLEDWLELLDGVRRRVGRGLARPDDEALVRRCLRERFPDADIG